MTKHHSPGWCCGMPPDSAKGSMQQGWQLRKNPCMRCGGAVESFGHIFHCSFVWPLYELTECYMVHVLGGKFFVLKARSICSNVVPQLKMNEHCVLVFTWHYVSCDLDNVTEGILWR